MKLLRDACLTASIVALFLLVAELSLRVFGTRYDASFYRLDRTVGYVLRPLAEGWNVKEHENYVRISSQGLRDREHAIARPPGVVRIAVIGDSFSEAREVAQSATYWSVLERELNRLQPPGAPRIEVLNFGVDGYGLAQEYFVIRNRIWRYDPQIVVLAGTLHSFVLHSSRKFDTATGEGPVPYFVYADGGLVLDETAKREQRDFVPPSYLSEVMQNATNESRLLALINVARRAIVENAGKTLRRARQVAANADTPERNLEREVLKGPVESDIAQAWHVGEGLIRMCRDETERHRAEFWLVLLDMAPQVDPDPTIRASVMHEIGLEDPFLADKLFAAFAQASGIRHTTIAPQLLAYAEEHGAILHGFPNRPRNSGHWNVTGHEAAGQIIARELSACSEALQPDSGLKESAPSVACRHPAVNTPGTSLESQ